MRPSQGQSRPTAAMAKPTVTSVRDMIEAIIARAVRSRAADDLHAVEWGNWFRIAAEVRPWPARLPPMRPPRCAYTADLARNRALFLIGFAERDAVLGTGSASTLPASDDQERVPVIDRDLRHQAKLIQRNNAVQCSRAGGVSTGS